MFVYVSFVVTMQAQKEAPSDMQCKDKFLLQSVVASAVTNPKDITQEMVIIQMTGSFSSFSNAESLNTRKMYLYYHIELIVKNTSELSLIHESHIPTISCFIFLPEVSSSMY